MSSAPCALYSRIRLRSGWLVGALRSWLARMDALARDGRGMAAVEFGLAAPLLLAALSPVIDVGLAFSQQIRLNQAADAGTQYASSNPYNSGTWATNVSNAVTNATTLALTPTVGSETCGCPNSNNTAIVTSGYGTPPSCTGSCSDGSSPGYYVTISARATYTSVMPYSILGSSTTLSSQAIVRVQ